MSPRSETFFAWVWRLNGLAILLLSLAGLAAALGIVANLALSSRERPDQSLERVAGFDVGAENLRLSGFSSIAGTSLLYATLVEQDEYVSSGFSKGYRTARNVLFFDTQARTTRWLFEDHDQLIPSLVFLKDPPGTGYLWEGGEASKEGQRVIGMVIESEARDGATGSNPSRQIAIASPDGRAPKTIVSSSQGLLGYHQSGTESVFVFYVAAGAARVLEINPEKGEVVSDNLLAAEP